ncbi:MAG: hypothetical protein SYNGOMJ08_00054 [Candidatus Syntrophoarchaeum sp. GoM_oil]|nr:MAG: hypothetical protein SYNGOMJ08_00054 [Candidatus Syntrophoarchaeum sp. GoM_oil]
MGEYIAKEICYFLGSGSKNTDTAIELAKKRCDELGIKHVVVASFTGKTGLAVQDAIKDAEVVMIGAHYGFKAGEEGKKLDAIWDKNLRLFEGRGGKGLRSTHALSGIERSVGDKYGGMYPHLLIADILRLFSQGVKVGVEVAVMAADAGFIPLGEEVLTIGGTKAGADTVMVLKSAGMKNFFELEVKEIVCMPR